MKVKYLDTKFIDLDFNIMRHALIIYIDNLKSLSNVRIKEPKKAYTVVLLPGENANTYQDKYYEYFFLSYENWRRGLLIGSDIANIIPLAAMNVWVNPYFKSFYKRMRSNLDSIIRINPAYYFSQMKRIMNIGISGQTQFSYAIALYYAMLCYRLKYDKDYNEFLQLDTNMRGLLSELLENPNEIIRERYECIKDFAEEIDGLHIRNNIYQETEIGRFIVRQLNEAINRRAKWIKRLGIIG